MDAITYTDLRQNLKTYMDKVIEDNDPLIITRKNNKNVVLISVDDYNSLMEQINRKRTNSVYLI